MANGLIYTLKITGDRLVGTPQSIDLDEIAIPPDDLSWLISAPSIVTTSSLARAGSKA